jgi:hypothetical protein
MSLKLNVAQKHGISRKKGYKQVQQDATIQYYEEQVNNYAANVVTIK